MILKLLLNTQMIWMIFIKILKNTIQIKKKKISIVFDDMIAGMLKKKKLNLRVTKLFIRKRKLKISLAFITQFFLDAHESVRLNSTHYFMKKIPSKQELRQIEFNHSSDIDFQENLKFLNLSNKIELKQSESIFPKNSKE